MSLWVFVVLIYSLVANGKGEEISATTCESVRVSLSGAEAKNFNVSSYSGKDSSVEAPTFVRSLNIQHVEELVHGVEIFGGGVTVTYRDDVIATVIGRSHHHCNFTSLGLVEISEEAALAIPKAMYAGQESASAHMYRIKLFIHPKLFTKMYVVDVRDGLLLWDILWINAYTEEVMLHYSNIKTSTGEEASIGIGVHGDRKNLTGLTSISMDDIQKRTLRSSNFRVLTFDSHNSQRPMVLGDVGTGEPGTWKDTRHPAMVDAHYHAHMMDEYLQAVHHFDYKKYYPSGLVSVTHVQNSSFTSRWNGEFALFGDGDGVEIIEHSAEEDLVGHEFGHAVIDATSKLLNFGYSGALGESFADIMGIGLEAKLDGKQNWLIGEDVYIASNGLRSLKDPRMYGQPTHLSDAVDVSTMEDVGGVHRNSGIVNHFFYLLAAGGSNADRERASSVEVQPIGLHRAEQLVFIAFTSLPLDADFCDARSATIAAAAHPDFTAIDSVRTAWDQVGVTEALCQQDPKVDACYGICHQGTHCVVHGSSAFCLACGTFYRKLNSGVEVNCCESTKVVDNDTGCSSASVNGRAIACIASSKTKPIYIKNSTSGAELTPDFAGYKYAVCTSRRSFILNGGMCKVVHTGGKTICSVDEATAQAQAEFRG